MSKVLKVKHILVKYEYEAQDIYKKLIEGKSFQDLAAKFSICSSAKQGGELGVFNPKRFVESFSEACEDLKLNEFSKPVRTQFGYHIIVKYESSEGL